MGERVSKGWTLCRVIAGMLLWAAALLWAGEGTPAGAQVTVSSISDTLYHADGTAASGTVLISWPAFTTAAGQTVPAGSTSSAVGAGGVLAVSLAPNAGATPMGTYYTVVYHLDDGSTNREYWVVPVSGSSLRLSAVRASVLPASVAMQTVSKQYVDQAIARAALTGVVPQDTSPYVVKTGDTMTGALVLPGDPTSALQAADKNYVDTNVTALQGGLAQKVSLNPAGTQVVTQPAGTQLEVNNLNGQLHAQVYQSQAGSDGVTNALASTDCANGCSVIAEQTYTGTDGFTNGVSGSHLTDERGGSADENFFNPQGVKQSDSDGRSIESNTTLTGPARKAASRASLHAYGLSVTENALAGGNNIFPQDVAGAGVPYFKSTYGATQTLGNNYTAGQHVLDQHVQKCYGVGDCLMGSQFLYSSGGFRDPSDEGAHPFDIQISEDAQVFRGTCTTGCTAGSTQVKVTATAAAGTQGEGRFLMDTAASKVINTGALTGAGAGYGTANFTGTSFPVSTMFSTATQALPQSGNMAPGTVVLAIQTTGAPAGYATNTAAAPAGSGVACIAAPFGSEFETAPYSVVDGTHIQMTLNKPHDVGAAIGIGGLCGYGLEQVVDTTSGIRQVFPVVGSLSATSLQYAGLATAVVGVTGATSGFANVSAPLLSLVRSGNVVTVTTSGNLPQDVNGLSVTVSGAADSSYNGTFPVTTTAANQFTYSQAGANSSTTGGTASVVTGSFALYPMAEVVGVYNAATKSVDGTLNLAPNTVAWAAGDTVEEPHYFQNKVAGDRTFVTQYMPRPTTAIQAGMWYTGLGAYAQGWIVQNATPNSTYFGNGGTHTPPASALVLGGDWLNSVSMQAGDASAIQVNCNSHGCGRWNSTYSLFQLANSTGGYDTVSFAPQNSTMTWNLRGTQYSMSPTSLTAGTINATTLNVTRVNGLQAATASSVGGVTLGPSASSAVLANVATSGSAADVSGLAASATVDTTNASNITSGNLSQARIASALAAPGAIGGTTPSTGAFTAVTSTSQITSGGVAYVSKLGSAGGLSTSNPGFTFDTTSQTASTSYGSGGNYIIKVDGAATSTGPSLYLGGSTHTTSLQGSSIFYFGANPVMIIDGNIAGHTAGYTYLGSGRTGTSFSAVPARLTVGTSDGFQVNDSGAVVATSFTETLFTPASSSASCNAGQFADDANFHYVCTAANTWKRVALSAF